VSLGPDVVHGPVRWASADNDPTLAYEDSNRVYRNTHHLSNESRSPPRTLRGSMKEKEIDEVLNGAPTARATNGDNLEP
jgi:hypothetical protein